MMSFCRSWLAPRHIAKLSFPRRLCTPCLATTALNSLNQFKLCSPSLSTRLSLQHPFRCSSTSTAEETSKPSVEKLEFKAETRQLLDIVTHSLYTDKEVFVRELVSNASDSLEKMRHLQASNQLPASSSDNDTPLEIRIELDEVTSSIVITDTGVGMTRDELIANLGTIAKSGSKKFIEDFMKSQELASDPSKGIIGKFGVGFYSSFMVGETVEVRSRSALTPDAPPKLWKSDGSGTYEISDLPEGVRQERGTSIQIFLKEDYWDFVSETRIENVLNRYSNFINFPIYLNGKLVNTQKAIWAMDPNDVTEEEYFSFYKYIAKAIDDPQDVYHFRSDAPVDIKALFFIPSFHSEKYGMERMAPGVSLYSRKVLIESKSPDILPGWMRFVKGVVDSEDLPLAISREKPQDSTLIRKLRRTLTQKFIAHLTKMATKEVERYNDEFYREFSFFLKEGICQDFDYKEKLAKLLRFETSKKLEKNENVAEDLVTLDTYISRMQPEQKDIFYLVAPTRESALNSPYIEAFEKAGIEVLLLFSTIDDFVMGNLETYEGRSFVSVEKSDIDLSKFDKKDDNEAATEDEKDELYEADRSLSSQEILDFCKWFKETLGEKKIASCTATNRLTSSPAIVTDNESGAMRRMMYMVDTSEGNRDGVPLPQQHVEINSKHPIIVGIHDIITTEPSLARVLAEQVFDNCLVAAGLLMDSRSMLPRMNDILICVLKGATKGVNMLETKSSEAHAHAIDTDTESIESYSTESEEIAHATDTEFVESNGTESEETIVPEYNGDEEVMTDNTQSAPDVNEPLEAEFVDKKP